MVLLQSWSKYKIALLSPEHQSPATTRTITEELFKAAYDLQKERRMLAELPSEDTFLMPSKMGLDSFNAADGLQQIARAYMHFKSDDELNHGFENWDEYKLERGRFHYIRRSIYWNGYYCSCYLGSKRKMCKHAVLIMIKKGMVEYPASVTAELLQPAKKRGRPKKVAGALVRD